MTGDLRAELAESLDQAEWEWLKPHIERDAVVVVMTELDLLEVGEAIANDNVLTVQRWISEKMIAKPSPAQVVQWSQNSHHRFTALIVQPYVLVQVNAFSP
jgi:hypothetical protein